MDNNKILTKEQVKGILDNAPANLDRKIILQKLVEKGFQLDGFNPSQDAGVTPTQKTDTSGTEANSFLNQSAAKQIFSKNFLKEVPEAAYETVVGGALKFIKSAVEAPRDIVQAVKGNEIPNTPGTDPITGKPITTIQSDFQEKIPEVLEGERTPLNAVAGSVADTAIGALDVLGAGEIARGVSKISKITADKVKSIVENSKKFTMPVDAPKKSGAFKTMGNIVEDVIPKAADLRDRSIAKALRLAPGDISTIQQSTGNEIGKIMNDFDLVKDTPGETLEAVAKFKRDNFNLVRDAVSLVDNKFTFEDIPQMKDSIDFLIKDLSGRKSNEYVEALKRLRELQKKPDFDLMEVQYVKNLFDDVESIYKRTGDARDAIVAQDKAQTIAPIRRFIEERVQEVYPNINIRALNNNVQTSAEILDAAIKRAAKADTSSFFHMGDLGVLGIGNLQSPGIGYAALFGKKLLESAPIQLRMSRYFAGKVKPSEVINGLTPQKLKELNVFIQKELKEAMFQEDAEKIEELRTLSEAVKKKAL